jgi:uncharacterized protein YjgD (DUF1641 family)
MASPITFEPVRRDPREALRRRIETAPVDHAEAVLEAFDVLQLLHERGALDIVRSALAASDELLDVAIGQADTPEATRALRHLLFLGGELARLKADDEAPASLWALLRRMRSEDSLRGLSAAVTLMENFGRHLHELRGAPPGGESS